MHCDVFPLADPPVQVPSLARDKRSVAATRPLAREAEWEAAWRRSRPSTLRSRCCCAFWVDMCFSGISAEYVQFSICSFSCVPLYGIAIVNDMMLHLEPAISRVRVSERWRCSSSTFEHRSLVGVDIALRRNRETDGRSSSCASSPSPMPLASLALSARHNDGAALRSFLAEQRLLC